MDALALTEHGNVSSHVQLEKAAKAEGIKPIFGCELYCNEGGQKQQRKNHLTVLAENDEGYRNLLKVVSLGWSEGYYFEPTVSGDILHRHKSGLFVLSGCLGSLLSTSLVGGKNVPAESAGFQRGLDVARGFKRAFGDHYYLECQTFPELDKTRAINEALEEISKKLKIPLVASGDVHYTEPGESDMQMVLHNVRGGGRQTLEEQARSWGYDIKLSPETDDNLVYKKLRATGLSKSAAYEAIMNSRYIADMCNVELPKVGRLRYPHPDKFKNSQECWEAALKWGWKMRGINSKPNREQYKEQLRKEMDVIESKDFVDYFLVVADAVNFAKNDGIPVGPARGSAAASLVCYLLRITEVDPLLFPNLVFERFIDITREDLPDIDLDFDDERRYEIREYLVKKYGQDKVANIGTFTKYKSKNSMDDIARVYKIPQWEVDKVKELIIERSGGDLRANETIEDTVSRFDEAKAVFDKYPELWKATQLEGNYRGMGVHAAGIVISNDPITDACAVYAREVKGEMTEVVSVNKYDAEYLGMLKIDVLGLSTMGMIRRSLELIGMSLNELYALPLDDPETMKGFQENDVVGVFQFDGRATRDVNAGVKPDNFDEIALVNALSRPGPLHNGATSQYIDVKRGVGKVNPLHPLYDTITKNTAYEIVYQEQILRIVGEIGDFDWTHRTHIRKIISQRKGDQMFQREWERFKKGALKKEGMTEEIAKEIWGNCVTSGSYAFNAAHCYSYAMLAYWTMWIKRHHPQAFYVACLHKYTKKDKQIRLLRDAVKKGIQILPPHPRKSGPTWKPAGKEAIRAGFEQIPGLGAKKAEVLASGDVVVKKWDDLVKVKGIGPITVKKMKEFCEADDPFDIYTLHNRLKEVRHAIESGELGDLPLPTHTSDQIPYTSGEDTPVVWLGVIRHRNLRNLWEVNQKRGKEINKDDVKDAHLDEWMIMLGEDEDEVTNVTINRFKWPRFKAATWKIRLEHDLVLVKGVKPGFMSARVIQVNNMWVIDPD